MMKRIALQSVARASILFFLLLFIANGCSNDGSSTDSPEQNPVRGTNSGIRRELVVVSYGGAYQESQRKAYFEPFARQYGVTVREETWSGDLAKLKAMVESGNVTWDVVDVEAHMVLLGARDNLLEPIDYSLTPRNELLPQAIHKYGVANCFWSTILAYNTHEYKPDRPRPKDWADFWNVAAYPGPRALRRDPVANLEFALLADGVPKENLYPIDVDRAFRSLDKIKDHVTVWWEAGEQPAQLLGSGEVVLSSAWNGRIYNAQQDNKPEAVEWEGGIISSDWWVIPRGSKNAAVAQEFIAFATSAGPQSTYPSYIPYGPVNTEAIKDVAADKLKDLPTSPENLSKQVFIDNQWWFDNKDTVMEKWNTWLLE